MTKKSRMTIIAILLLLAVALYFVSGTYARYASDFTGEGKVDVAKWAVSVGGKTNTDEEKKFDLTLTPESNANVANGKIAPSYSATGTIAVDLAGTEVAVALKATIGDLAGTILANNEKVSVTAAVETDGSTAGTGELTGDGYKIALPDGEAFSSSNGKYNVKVTVTWTNDENNNTIDTTTGGTGGEVKIPVTLKLTQLIKGE